MADTPEIDLDALWDEFHRVVNMTSAELHAWLRTESAAEEAEQLPEFAGSDDGRHVLAILRKRRMDLTDDDIREMRKVVDTVHEQRRSDLATTAGQDHWRYRLMMLGHDPLKPA